MSKLVPFSLDTEENVTLKRDRMSQRGWPRRTLEVAATADLQKPAIIALGAWKYDERNVVVINGGVGVGKTVAAARWCMGVANRIGFVRAPTFAASSRYDRETREMYYDAEGLCLDDLGAEYADKKESFLVDLDELIDTFYSDRRPLLITTNMKSPTFKTRYGLRIWDRLQQCANWIPIKSDGSLRGGQ